MSLYNIQIRKHDYTKREDLFKGSLLRLLRLIPLEEPTSSQGNAVKVRWLNYTFK